MTLKKQVEEILRDYPETRNSDITLTIEIWKRFYPQRVFQSERYAGSGGKHDCISVQSLYDLPHEDNVKRIRAKFNAEGKFWPTEAKIARARGIQENEWRQALGYPSVEETKQPTKKESYISQAINGQLSI